MKPMLKTADLAYKRDWIEDYFRDLLHYYATILLGSTICVVS